MFFYFALFSSLMVLTHSTDAVCCHSDCLGHTGLDASVPLCPSRHARQVSQRDQRPTSWQNSHRSISHSTLLSFFSFFFFFCSFYLYLKIGRPSCTALSRLRDKRGTTNSSCGSSLPPTLRCSRLHHRWVPHRERISRYAKLYVRG